MKKRHLVITIAALSILCLSGCHKDKPVETQVPLETIAPETTSETISDKLDDNSDSLDIQISPEPKAVGIDENGEEIKDNTPETSPSDTETEKETLTAEEESQRAIEESENQQLLKEIQESVAESIATSDETMAASDYQKIDDAIDAYNKKQVEEWSSKADWSQLK